MNNGLGHILRTHIIIISLLFSAPVWAADEKDGDAPIQAKDLEVLPIAAQKEDGFDGKTQTAFAAPPIRNFSAEMLRKVTEKKKKAVKPKAKSKGPKAKPTKKTKAKAKGKKLTKATAKKKPVAKKKKSNKK